MKIGLRVSTILGLAVLFSQACAQDGHKLSATSDGDLSYVLTERTRPDQAEIDGCGDPGRGSVTRATYLQQVTSSSALVMFTTTSSEEQIVDVTRPDGTEVASVTAAKDESANPANGAWQAVAKLEGLDASTLYCYAIRGATERVGFRTAAAAATDHPVRFIAFGDSGSGGRYQAAVRDQMFTVPFDFIVHVGDIAYDDGTLGQFEGQYFGVYSDLIRSFSSFLVAGNHDYGTARGAPMREVFSLPENGSVDAIEKWYSFDWGNVHVVGLDTEEIGAEQAQWLDQDLGATDKPWKIVLGHRPPYSSGEHGNNSAFRSQFCPIIEKHGVQLVLTGHDHDYERTVPVGSTTYIVTGGGGRSTRAVGHSSFTVFSEDVHHFVQVEVQAEEMFVHAIDGVGHEFDSARIPLTI